MIYYNINNKVYYNRFKQNVANNLPHNTEQMSHFSYPNDLIFGLNYESIDNIKLAFNKNPTVNYFLNKLPSLVEPGSVDLTSTIPSINIQEESYDPAELLPFNIISEIGSNISSSFDEKTYITFDNVLSSGYLFRSSTIVPNEGNGILLENLDFVSAEDDSVPYSGNIKIYFTVPYEVDFNRARVYHVSPDGDLEDITVTSGTDIPDPLSRTIVGLSSSFSTFMIAPYDFGGDGYVPVENMLTVPPPTLYPGGSYDNGIILPSGLYGGTSLGSAQQVYTLILSGASEGYIVYNSDGTPQWINEPTIPCGGAMTRGFALFGGEGECGCYESQGSLGDAAILAAVLLSAQFKRLRAGLSSLNTAFKDMVMWGKIAQKTTTIRETQAAFNLGLNSGAQMRAAVKEILYPALYSLLGAAGAEALASVFNVNLITTVKTCPGGNPPDPETCECDNDYSN